MREFLTDLPDPDVLLAFAPEELGARILFLVRRRLASGQLQQGQIHPGNASNEVVGFGLGGAKYPDNRIEEIQLALSEAWAWLEAQGLVVPPPGSFSGNNGWRVLSRRARTFEDPADLKTFTAARRLHKEMLHPRIADRVWLSFMRGEFDEAVFFAMKQVEVALRTATGEEPSTVGVALARRAFKKDDGILTDSHAESGEQQAMSDLFAGALGVFKNPQSHRNVDMDDPNEAASAVMLASYLLHIIDGRTLQGTS